MITKGIITDIDITGNTCKARVPLFETAGIPDKYIIEATFSITPGIYNSYVIGDVVFLGFEDNSINSAVVIGKLFKSTTDEKNRKFGAITCDSLQVNKSINLPITTTIGDLSAKDLANLNNKLSLLLDKIETKAPAEVFSTDEQIIGTWLYGKVLYRKTYIIVDDIPENTTWGPKEIDLASLNFDTVMIDMTHTLQIGTRYSLNEYNAPNGDFFNTYIVIPEQKLYYRGRTPAQEAIKKFIITIEYTKK